MEKIVFNWSLLRKDFPECISIVMFLWSIVFCQTDVIIEIIWGCIFASFLAVSAVMDYRYLLLFNRLTYTLFFLGIIKNGMDGLFWGIIFGFIMLSIRCIKPEGMGWGDVKYAAAIGVWMGNESIFLVMLLSFCTAAVFSILLMLINHNFSLKQCIPFGPFLSLGGFVVYFWGDWLWL